MTEDKQEIKDIRLPSLNGGKRKALIDLITCRKNDEKNRQTFVGTGKYAYICNRNHKNATNMRTARQNGINKSCFHSYVMEDIPNRTTLQAMSECESGNELEELTIDNVNNLEEYISKL